MLAFEGDAHVEWFEGYFDDYEADKIRPLGTEAVEPKRIKYKKFAREGDAPRPTQELDICTSGSETGVATTDLLQGVLDATFPNRFLSHT